MLYLAYGLGIHSETRLPGLPLHGASADTPPDVEIRLGGQAEEGGSSLSREAGEGRGGGLGELRVFDPAGRSFLLRHGREILVEAPRLDPAARAFLLGPALALLLQQRGWLALHGSAVAIDGQAVAFLGRCGDGKSTLAAALVERGRSLLADDTVAVDPADPELRVAPGIPQLKLWPETVRALGGEPSPLPRVQPGTEKRSRRLPHGRFCRRALPLARIYVLEDGEEERAVPLAPREALFELVRHTYGGKILGATGAAAGHFLACSALAARVPVFRLERPRRLERLGRLADLVEGLRTSKDSLCL